MALQAITKEEFHQKRWQPHSRLFFAASRAVVELDLSELPVAAANFTFGFLKQGDGSFLPAVLMGIQPDKNLFVAKDGSWLAGYVPSLFRVSPFALGVTEEGKKILCLDDTFSEPPAEQGFAFFNENGEPGPELLQVNQLLSTMDSNRLVTSKACAALDEAGVLQPWKITLQTKDGNKTLEGLHHIDQAALESLPGDKLETLMKCGALSIAYCQMVSTQHLQKLGMLADSHAHYEAMQKQQPASKDIDLSFLSKGGTLNFG
ncbi:SapC family protein [Noviherbaspirillum galbum]|uniref:SapC family protein n=1 Tax=Noviherbaspirillum galbum TaxID=2709383 RepID=A0A6B3SK21_9BURK|nr:SapC family protein [Noviherbaspirillum galbum]NEX60898.1 SapC family protein [Noviherbaspirillum galbum]